METLRLQLHGGRMTATDLQPTPTPFHVDRDRTRRLIERRHVATLATVSAAGRPHVATVLYELADDALYVSTGSDSRKARNVADTGRAAVTIAVRRLPIGPPASIQFQTTAEVLGPDDPNISALVTAGRLKGVTSHGELDLPDGCFLRIRLPARAATYGLGMSLWHLARHPLDAAGQAEL